MTSATCCALSSPKSIAKASAAKPLGISHNGSSFLVVSDLKTRSGPMLRASTIDVLGIMWNKRRLDYELAKQMAAQQTYAKGRVNYRFDTNGTHVGGPSLLNTVVVC